MAEQHYSVSLDNSSRQLVVTADEGESVRYPYAPLTLSVTDAHAAAKRFHRKRQAKTAQFFAMFSEHRMGKQQAIECACDFIERDMTLGKVTINSTFTN